MRRMLAMLTATILIIAGLSPVYAVLNSPSDLMEQNPAFNGAQQTNYREPSWAYLDRMSPAEKANAIIQLEFGVDATPDVKTAASEIEILWNSGQFDNALAAFRQLDQLNNGKSAAIALNWRNPIPTYEISAWDADVRIGNRDSIYFHRFDIHRVSGHLFAILAFNEGTNGFWTVNLSTDDGDSWNETFVWVAGASEQSKSISVTVLGNNCYVGYRASDYPYEARLRRFYASDGAMNGNYSTVYTNTAPDTIKEVELTSNQDYFNDRIYYLGLGKDGDLRYFWDDTSAASWTEIATGVTNADRGLDATCNEGFTSKYLFASYIDINDTLHIDCKHGTNPWANTKKLYIGYSPITTSISAYHDTVICFHEYLGTSVYCRYQVSYNEGTTWLYGGVDDTTTNISGYPDVTARHGGGFGVVYRYYSPIRELRFVKRGYPSVPGWATPVSIAEVVPDPTPASVEYLGGGSFGVVFTSYISPFREAYFDRSTPACEYYLGDINGDGVRIGGDVTYGVRYFKGIGAPPPDSCFMDSTHAYLYVAGDVNGNCEFRGSDITRLVSFFKGTAVISNCHFFPTAPLKSDNQHELPSEVFE